MNKWVLGARPKTLPAAIAPVVTATALAYHLKSDLNWLNALLSLVVGLLLQIGVNYSNDYSDGIKGTDTNRVGPIRLVASGLASAKSVKNAAIVSYSVAALAGLLLSIRTNPILILFGFLAILAAWFYTGGKNPYGYRGLGDVSVFIFFGLVATVGTFYVETRSLSFWALLLGVQMGLFSCAILAVNNLRDLPKDKEAGKRTLAVRFGDLGARKYLNALLLLALLIQIAFLKLTYVAIIPILLLPYGLRISKKIRMGLKGAELIPLLGEIAKIQTLASLWITISLIFGKA